MKAVKVQASTIICTSPSIELNSESIEAVTEESPYYGKEGYGVAW